MDRSTSGSGKMAEERHIRQSHAFLMQEIDREAIRVEKMPLNEHWRRLSAIQSIEQGLPSIGRVVNPPINHSHRSNNYSDVPISFMGLWMSKVLIMGVLALIIATFAIILIKIRHYYKNADNKSDPLPAPSIVSIEKHLEDVKSDMATINQRETMTPPIEPLPRYGLSMNDRWNCDTTSVTNALVMNDMNYLSHMAYTPPSSSVHGLADTYSQGMPMARRYSFQEHTPMTIDPMEYDSMNRFPRAMSWPSMSWPNPEEAIHRIAVTPRYSSAASGAQLRTSPSFSSIPAQSDNALQPMGTLGSGCSSNAHFHRHPCGIWHMDNFDAQSISPQGDDIGGRRAHEQVYGGPSTLEFSANGSGLPANGQVYHYPYDNAARGYIGGNAGAYNIGHHSGLGTGNLLIDLPKWRNAIHPMTINGHCGSELGGTPQKMKRRRSHRRSRKTSLTFNSAKKTCNGSV